MLDNLAAIFAAYDDEFLHFERIPDPPSQRADLCAFLLLDTLVPAAADIVWSAEHHEISLDVSPVELARVALEEDILYLVRCGVRYDSGTDSLCMFV